MPSVVKNQSQWRVPPMPWMTFSVLSAKGNFRPDLTTAELLPAAGLPITAYQGSSYKAAAPEVSPSLDDLISLTASTMRSRTACTSSRLSLPADLTALSASACKACSSCDEALAALARRTAHTISQAKAIRPSTTAAQISPT